MRLTHTLTYGNCFLEVDWPRNTRGIERQREAFVSVLVLVVIPKC